MICAGGEEIARHQRSYQREDMVFDPMHYLPLLEKKIGAFDQAAPLQGWALPDGFATLRRLLEARIGKAGTAQGFPCCCHSPLPCVPPPLPRRNRPVLISLASGSVAAFPEVAIRSASASSLCEACSAFTHVAARMVAEPPRAVLLSERFGLCRYLHNPLRLLPAGAKVAERDSHPLGNGAFPRRTLLWVIFTGYVK